MLTVNFAAYILGQALRAGTLDLPEDSVVPVAEHHGSLPYFFVGDEAFPLQWDLIQCNSTLESSFHGRGGSSTDA